MRCILMMLAALALSSAPAWAEPSGLRVGDDIILEPITEVPLAEAFGAPEFVHGTDAVIGIWRFSYEDAAIDGAWQAIGLIVVSEYGEGIEPVGARVWARGEITSGDSAELTATPLTPPDSRAAPAFRLGLTLSRGTATLTVTSGGVVEIDGQRLGVMGP